MDRSSLQAASSSDLVIDPDSGIGMPQHLKLGVVVLIALTMLYFEMAGTFYLILIGLTVYRKQLS
jgi:hypothetical protein